MNNDCIHSIETIRTLRQRIAELEAELTTLRAEFATRIEAADDAYQEQLHASQQAIAAKDAESSIVDRIWKLFGPPTYEQLAGQSIYDLVQAEIDGHKRQILAREAAEAERDRLREALMQLRGSVDGILPDYEYLNQCKQLACAALAASEPKEPKRYNLCGHPDHPDGAACQCMDPDAASEPKSDCSICRGPGKDHRHVCE